jgi:hypothetical protein
MLCDVTDVTEVTDVTDATEVTGVTDVTGGPFRGTEAVARGLVTPDRLYGPRFRRVFPDIYLHADQQLDQAARSRAAYLLVAGQGGVLAGYSAALLLGADCVPAGAPPEVLVPRFQKRCAGLRIRYATLAAEDMEERDGCRLTTAERTAWDLARRLPTTEAVVVLDAVARVAPFRPAALLDRRARQPGARGCRRLDELVALADPRAESPGETRLRVRLVRAGLPPPEVQYRISDEYGFVLARADLAYPGAKLALEYDGAVHFDRNAAHHDRQRDAILAGHGWLTIRLCADDLCAAQTVQRIDSLLARRTQFNRGGLDAHREPRCG